jgi:predicted kinase
MNGKSKPYAILVFGAPCSGKTAFAEKFSSQFKAPYFNFDDLESEHNINRKTTLIIIEQVVKSGQTIVIEGGINTEDDRDEIRKLLKSAGYQSVLVWIQTDVMTLKNRLKARLKSVDKAKVEFDRRINMLEAPADSELPVVLSGKHTFATQLKMVLSHLTQ